jgi:hypothetical protein
VKWSLPIVSFCADCADSGAGQLKYFGEAGDVKSHGAFGLGKFLEEHELRLPGFDRDRVLFSEERADILCRERCRRKTRLYHGSGE